MDVVVMNLSITTDKGKWSVNFLHFLMKLFHSKIKYKCDNHNRILIKILNCLIAVLIIQFLLNVTHYWKLLEKNISLRFASAL
jgi:hypothetical protein